MEGLGSLIPQGEIDDGARVIHAMKASHIGGSGAIFARFFEVDGGEGRFFGEMEEDVVQSSAMRVGLQQLVQWRA